MDSLNQEAISAIESTQDAILAIEAGDRQKALQQLEAATGKLDILLAREPELALIPVSSTVEVIDTAPLAPSLVEELSRRLEKAVRGGDYAEAREVLANLMSEVRTRMVNLPLASYPDAMKVAASFLDNENLPAAQEVLQVALSTLVITEETQPIPVINAQTDLLGAIAIADTDKGDALRLLGQARQKLKLAQSLGYVREDTEYAELDEEIGEVEKKLRRNVDIGSAFFKLEDKLSGFLKRIAQ